MSTKIIEMTGIQCDHCYELWTQGETGFVAFPDDQSARENISDNGEGWHVSNLEDAHFCLACAKELEITN